MISHQLDSATLYHPQDFIITNKLDEVICYMKDDRYKY